jgi:hypothetical protein
MTTSQYIELGVVVCAALLIVYRSYRQDKQFDHFRETCKLRHNPVDEAVYEIKKEIKSLRKDTTAIMIRLGVRNGST